MSNYIFLIANYYEGPTTYYAINEDRITTLKVSDTYDRYGQRVSNADAGDIITLLTDKAIKIANDEFNQDSDEYINKFALGDYIAAYEFNYEFDAVIESCDEGIDYEEGFTECEGFNYHDGHNFQTIITRIDCGEPSHDIVEDDELIANLNKAIEEMNYIGECPGIKQYEGNGFRIEDSCWQGTWASYSLIPQDEYEQLFQ